ncbi:NAD-dependent epimerase/dehydratase family protein [Pseudoduganella sp. UC29_71]|uniref:NAD-dependent epimerase/dehydratase family protein n=1 Tax=Pseudoduganella sp. UC29_71 TaxID=3350174 RepID=UPI00366DBFB1
MHAGHVPHILITGASGFVGRHVVQALLAKGCRVTAAGRTPVADARIAFVAADFSHDTSAAAWLPRLQGVDVVINTVGIIRERGGQRFDRLHVAAPRALFAACAKAGVRRVIQLSALGADENAFTAYHLSKKAADDYLAALPVNAAIVQPSLIYGPGGGSAELFKTLAAMPLGIRFGSSPQPVQPIHIDDVTEALTRLALQQADAPHAAPAPPRRRNASRWSARSRCRCRLISRRSGTRSGWVNSACSPCQTSSRALSPGWAACCLACPWTATPCACLSAATPPIPPPPPPCSAGRPKRWPTSSAPTAAAPNARKRN